MTSEVQWQEKIKRLLTLRTRQFMSQGTVYDEGILTM